MDGLARALNGNLANPHWGEIKPSWQRLSREESEARRQADHAELARYRRSLAGPFCPAPLAWLTRCSTFGLSFVSGYRGDVLL